MEPKKYLIVRQIKEKLSNIRNNRSGDFPTGVRARGLEDSGRVYPALFATAHRGSVPRGARGLGAAGLPAHPLLQSRQSRHEHGGLPRVRRRSQGGGERGQGGHGGVRRDQGPGAGGSVGCASTKRPG